MGLRSHWLFSVVTSLMGEQGGVDGKEGGREGGKVGLGQSQQRRHKTQEGQQIQDNFLR